MPATEPEDRHDDGDDHGPEPDPEALPGPVEPGHPTCDVAAGEVGQKDDDQEHDRPDQPDGLGLVGVGGRLIQVGGQADPGSGGRE